MPARGRGRGRAGVKSSATSGRSASAGTGRSKATGSNRSVQTIDNSTESMETPKDVIIEYSEGNGSANSDIDSRSAPSGTDLSSVIQPDIAQIDQLLSHFKAEIANNGAESVLLDRLIADGTLERTIAAITAPDQSKSTGLDQTRSLNLLLVSAVMLPYIARIALPYFNEVIARDGLLPSILASAHQLLTEAEKGGFASSVFDFLDCAFRSIHIPYVRMSVAPFFSIMNLTHLKNRIFRKERLELIAKQVRHAEKKINAAPNKEELQHRANWLYTLILQSCEVLVRSAQASQSVAVSDRHNNSKSFRNDPTKNETTAVLVSSFINMLITIVSLYPLRRHVNVLLKDIHIVTFLRSLPQVTADSIVEKLVDDLEKLMKLNIDDRTGETLPIAELRRNHDKTLSKLQRIAMKDFSDELKIFALSNLGSICSKADLAEHFTQLSPERLNEFAEKAGLDAGIREQFAIKDSSKFLTSALTDEFCWQPSPFERLRDERLMPDEDMLFNKLTEVLRSSLIRNVYPIPRLFCQYLNGPDLIWKNIELLRLLFFTQLRRQLSRAISEIQPYFDHRNDVLLAKAASPYALHIKAPAMLEVQRPYLGKIVPSKVLYEVQLSLDQHTDEVRYAWECLEPGDVVMLVALIQRHKTSERSWKIESEQDDVNVRVKHVRCALVHKIMDMEGNIIRHNLYEQQDAPTENLKGGTKLRMQLLIDPKAYKLDQEKSLSSAEKADVYEQLNLIVRMFKRNENSLPTIEHLQMNADFADKLQPQISDWLLGYGIPKSENIMIPKDGLISLSGILSSIEELALVVPDKAERGAVRGEPITHIKLRRHVSSEDEDGEVRWQLRVSSGDNSIDNSQKNGSKNFLSQSDPFTPSEVKAIVATTTQRITNIQTVPGTRYMYVAAAIISSLHQNNNDERILIIARDIRDLKRVLQFVCALNGIICELSLTANDTKVPDGDLLLLGGDKRDEFGVYGRVEYFMQRRSDLLDQVTKLAKSINVPGDHGSSCETADYFYQMHVRPRISEYNDQSSAVQQSPFEDFVAQKRVTLSGDPDFNSEILQIEALFKELEFIRPLELIRDDRDRANHLIGHISKVVCVTYQYAKIFQPYLREQNMKFRSLIVLESHRVLDHEVVLAISCNSAPQELQRVVLLGDRNMPGYSVGNVALDTFALINQSFFAKYGRPDTTYLQDLQADVRPSIVRLYADYFPGIRMGVSSDETLQANAGFAFEYQFIDVQDYNGAGETSPSVNYFQNVGEAEYAVALFQYMRLLGYPAKSISIFTSYEGQTALIDDVLKARCDVIKFFGRPQVVSKFDNYYDSRTEVVIVSLVRTRELGILRDMRQLMAGLVRAQKGLYILGRARILQSMPGFSELKKKLMGRPQQLTLVTGEMYPTQRRLDDQINPAGVAVMQDVAHLSHYVFQMTQRKIERLQHR